MQPVLMVKRSLLVLSVAVLDLAAVSLLTGGNAVDPFHPSGPGRKPGMAARGESATMDADGSGERVPRSRRHADGAVEKHRERMGHLMDLEKEVKWQETELEGKRKIIAAIVRRKQMMFHKADPRYVPLSGIPKGTGPETGDDTVEDAAVKDLANDEDVVKRSRSVEGYVEARQDFETDRELLKQMQHKLDEERRRLKGAEE